MSVLKRCSSQKVKAAQSSLAAAETRPLKKKLSQDALRVLSYFHKYPANSHYGRELARTLEISSATTVRWLLRLEDVGWLRSDFQKGPRQTHRPKRFYRLTSRGFEGSRRLLKDVAELDTVKEGQTRLLELSFGQGKARVGERGQRSERGRAVAVQESLF
ncbi:hypothetical protein BH24DEI2_BH24DEI2_22390 [soil metagenome]